MPTADQVLDVARSQIGTVENARGEQKYGAYYGLNGPAWCAMFVWWCFGQVPGGTALIPKTAYTPTFYAWFQQHGQASRTPVKGALVFYDWPDSVARVQHVGIVEAVNADGSITTIEGNTTSGQAGDQSHGGGVWRRRRSTSAVVGYGLPAYSGAPTPTSPKGPLMALTDSEQAELLALARNLNFQLITGPDANRWGWPTFAGGTNENLTVVDYLRRANAQLADIQRRHDAIETGKTPAGPPSLTEGDLDAIAARVVALLGQKASA